MPQIQHAEAGPRTRALFSALLAAFIFLPAFAGFPENSAAAEEEPQLLSARGEDELRGVLSAGRLDNLQWPQFGDCQAELQNFYKSVNYSLAWINNSRPTAKARAVIKLLETADNEGLPAEDYDGPLWKDRLTSLERHSRHASEPELMRFDLALTICAMRYLLDLHLGRLNPKPARFAFKGEPDIRGPSDFLLKRVLPAPDAEAAFSEAEPPFPAYRRLTKAVQLYRGLALRDDGEKLPVPGHSVRPGKSYSGIPRLTRLLSLLGDLPPQPVPAPDLYTGELVEAVKRFQGRHGLPPDGVLGRQTLRQLNIPLDQRLRQLRLALERWRWLPHLVSRPPIIVNIPEFRLYDGDDTSHKVVVGKAFANQTPVFASLLTEVIFRPPWNVPMSIQHKEMIKEIEKNPYFLKGQGFEVINSAENVVSSGEVSAGILAKLRDGRLSLRQRPGPKNSLGLVKFLMPNPYDVYLHGTPAQGAFWELRRDMSHGCIRVEDPETLADWVLRGQPEWTPRRIRAAMNGTRTITVSLTEPVPVFIQYGTAVAGEDGEVRFFEDIYSRDAAEGTAFEQRLRLAEQ